MTYCVIDACFPVARQSYGVACQWLLYELEKAGASLAAVGVADVILISCVDPRNAKVIRSLRSKNKRATIIAGGPGALSPATLARYADIVCVGNGQRMITTLLNDGVESAAGLPEAYIDGESRPVEVAAGFPWRVPPIEGEDGRFRVWCGVGCKRKCGYCQTGWAIPWHENPCFEDVIQSVRRLDSKGKQWSYVSNDINQHAWVDRLPETASGSYTLDGIRKHGIPKVRQVRIGVEGVSARLRSYVGKPIKTDDIVRASTWLGQNGKSVRWFMIAGLPTETVDDWGELKDAIQHWRRISSKGVLGLSFTAWQTEPATPLGAYPVTDDYWQRWEEFREWFFSGGGWSNRIKLMPPAKPETRMTSCVARMATTEQVIRKGGDWGPNDRVEYPYKALRNRQAQRYAQEPCNV